MKKINYFYKKEHGAVSMFIVIFTMLLISVITVSFIRIMSRDQQQATADDLSQSAYDSALAGVEDAKRALLRYQRNCPGGNGCDELETKFNGTNCDVLEEAGVVMFEEIEGNKEVTVQTTSGGNDDFDQAYTCVTINLDTPDYRGTLNVNESKLIPLVSKDSFNIIAIDWFTSSDASNSKDIGLPSDADISLPILSEWHGPSLSKNPRPALLRTQFIQHKNSFELGEFDGNEQDSGGKSATLFLYPSPLLEKPTFWLKEEDPRRTNNTGVGIKRVKCEKDFSDKTYACSTKIRLTNSNDFSGAFLRLTTLYSKTSYRVTLMNRTTAVSFHEVQPAVDSTGRTNDVFRRVEARVESQLDFPYPENAVDITGNLCKDFMVSTQAAGTIPDWNKCQP